MSGGRTMALVAAAGLAAGSCNFAVKHPAVTAGIVGGTVALGTCELASSDHAACFEVSGGAGAGLAVVTALALWLGTYEDTSTAAGPDGFDPRNLPPAPVFVPKDLPPPPAPAPAPAPVDAGVEAPPPPAPPPDAGAGDPDAGAFVPGDGP